jgi:hypothetical protein
MKHLTLKTLKEEFKALTGKNLQLQGGIHNYDGEYSLAYSRDGVSFYVDDIARARYTLQGKSGDQRLDSTRNAKFLSSGRKIVLIQRLVSGEYILHGLYEYRGKLEVLYHPGEDGVERRVYRAVLEKL